MIRVRLHNPETWVVVDGAMSCYSAVVAVAIAAAALILRVKGPET